MQKFSILTHTVGYDGKNTVAEMIQHAIKLKWEAIGISNHIISLNLLAEVISSYWLIKKKSYVKNNVLSRCWLEGKTLCLAKFNYKL